MLQGYRMRAIVSEVPFTNGILAVVFAKTFMYLVSLAKLSFNWQTV